jgi:N-acetylmuramoyl-L-alanine amidase
METLQPDTPLVNRVVPSPNHNERRGGTPDCPRQPDMLVLHYTGLKADDARAWRARPGACALAWLCNPAAEVSSHYLVEEDGEIIQLVSETQRAWHAGVSSWMGDTDLNSAAIGIEIANLGHEGGLPDFPPKQIKAVIALCADIARRRKIPQARVLGHSDIAPGRKADPGEKFPWAQLYIAGAGHWVEPVTPDLPGDSLLPGDTGPAVSALRHQLRQYGYGLPDADAYDTMTEQTVLAFQRHFRPQKCDGIADASTRATLRKLLENLPAATQSRHDT